ncbi:MAG: hypothetical protein IKL52_05335 [Candidatus Gastranaerophilales bacterium]|nr:hypothetical protein [Candidatus Gastranaerophilales bacterium]
MLSISPVKINTFLPKQTKSNLKRQTQSDVFIKSTPSFKGNMSYAEKQELERDFRSSIYTGNSEKLIAFYEQNPKAIEEFLWFPQELKMFDDERIDRKFGYDEAGKSLYIYDCSSARSPKNISLLNKTLLLSSHKDVLSPLLDKIAQKNPDFFRKEYIISMYANGECEEAISTLAKKDNEKVFQALESTFHTFNIGSSKKHLAIENLKITPQRQKIFETLFEIDPLRTSYIVSNLPAQRRKEFNFDESQGNNDIKAVLNVINSNDDILEANKKLLNLYDKSPEAVIKTMLSPCQKTGELYINSMMKDKNRNYHGIMLYLLLKDSNKFFEIAQKSDFMWHAANNRKQSYLELFEQALFIDPQKTKDILAKPSENRLIYPRTTPAMECVDNESFDYTELFKAFYQEDINSAFELFASKVDWRTPNLLTYYVNKKGYKAEDFISYLTNQNLRFIKSLLSSETLTEIKDLRYKTAMTNLNRAKTELENEFGRKLTQTEERVMKRIAGVEKEMREEVKTLNGRIDGLSNYVDRLGQEVCEHIYPPSRTSSDYGINYFTSETTTSSKKTDPLSTWHFPPAKPYGPGVI